MPEVGKCKWGVYIKTYLFFNTLFLSLSSWCMLKKLWNKLLKTLRFQNFKSDWEKDLWSIVHNLIKKKQKQKYTRQKSPNPFPYMPCHSIHLLFFISTTRFNSCQVWSNKILLTIHVRTQWLLYQWCIVYFIMFILLTFTWFCLLGV